MDSATAVPRRADEHRDAIADSLRGAEGVFVGVDFDGTLAPIEESPETPEISTDCRVALSKLAARPDVEVGVFSGRGLADLRDRVGVDGVVYAGNHGLELERDGEETVHPAAATRQPLVRDAAADIEARVGSLEGCEVEDKGLTLTVHYRRSPPDVVDEVREGVQSVVPEDDPDLRVSDGKEILEVRPSIQWDKGSAMLYVTEHLGQDRRLVYLGDDVTDEDVFEILEEGDVGVHVGQAESLADYRLDSQADVAPFLEWLADAGIDRDEDD